MQSSVQKKRIEGKASSRDREISMIDFTSTKVKSGRKGGGASRVGRRSEAASRTKAGRRSEAMSRAETGRRSEAAAKAEAGYKSEVALWELAPPEKSLGMNYRMKEKSGGAAVRGYQVQTVQGRKRRQARRRRAYLYRALAFSMLVLCLAFVSVLVGFAYKCLHEEKKQKVIPVSNIPVDNEPEEASIEAPDIVTDLLEINDYSRPGTPLGEVNNIFVHYTANPGTSAAQNRSYFSNLGVTHERSASAHIIIGYDGEIIQCIPLDEQAYAVMTRNEDSISIECCYLEEDGKFTRETYDSLVSTLAWLTEKYGLACEDVLRHYDCGGKLCPLYYVEHEDAWDKLLADVAAYRARQ